MLTVLFLKLTIYLTIILQVLILVKYLESINFEIFYQQINIILTFE